MTELEKAAQEWWVANRREIFSLTEAFLAGAKWQAERDAKLCNEESQALFDYAVSYLKEGEEYAYKLDAANFLDKMASDIRASIASPDGSAVSEEK